MSAVPPRFATAKQPGKVSVKVLKGLVHPLKNRHIHIPAPPCTPSLPVLPTYHINRRCNTSSLSEEYFCATNNVNIYAYISIYSYTMHLFGVNMYIRDEYLLEHCFSDRLLV